MTRFATTRWSLIFDARQEPQAGGAALAEICRLYRQPVLDYIRSRTPGGDGEDLAQDFFARLLEQRWDVRATPERGSFRAFLLTALRRFLIDAAEREHAGKRGGAWQRVGFVEDAAELAAPHTESPEQAFTRGWMRTLVGRATDKLRDETASAGKAALYAQLSGFLLEPPDSADYPRLAEQLGLRVNTLAVAVHRLRQRLRELVREEVLHTVDNQDDLDVELDGLRSAFRSLS
jgi:DNA-directed RNA polymerase specialized sigma24 family protein